MPTPDTVFERVRSMCLALPETREVMAWGHPNFKAGTKMFVAFEHYEGRPSVAFRLPLARLRTLLDDERFFLPRVGASHGWICLALTGTMDWSEVEQLVRDSHSAVTAKRSRAPRARTKSSGRRRTAPSRRAGRPKARPRNARR
jgi:predicted DNA-binding protein (MmcQ/YjbR family)